MVQLYDGDWNFQHRVDPFLIEADFQWKLNEAGDGTLVLPVKGAGAATACSAWLLNPWGRLSAKDTHVRVDKDGARWTGKLEDWHLTKTPEGERAIRLEFKHEFKELQRIICWPNPFLPSIIQFPKAWTLFGNAAHSLKTTLYANLMRRYGSWWTLPDDPLDPSKWTSAMDTSGWSIVVKPGSKAQDKTPATIISGRMKYFHEIAEEALADCQLMVETRRWFVGDPEPWAGAKLRNGALVVDIVDKSGWWSDEGTSTIGNLWTGFTRTVQNLLGNNIDTESTIINEPTVVPEYQQSGWIGTMPKAPYVLYRDREITGVESIDFSYSPASTVQVVAGGQSMPGVNEAMSAGVQAAGNALGTFVMVPTAGTIADTFLKPLYSDVFFAFTQHKSSKRAQQAGVSAYFETFATGADTALTLSSLVAVRKSFWDTREMFAHQMTLGDGAPWFIGDQGQGHFWLGDRVGSTIRELPAGKIIVEQVTEIRLSISRGHFGWEATLGDFAATESATDRFIRGVNKLTGAIKDHGVWG